MVKSVTRMMKIMNLKTVEVVRVSNASNSRVKSTIEPKDLEDSGSMQQTSVSAIPA
jgi:hypothetical protein